jgi:tRNA (mo5U34)-methyltransferase
VAENEIAERLRARVATVPVWYHQIDLGHGVVTPGHRGWDFDTLVLPSLEGRTVLDVGAWDGYFSFEAERRGASRVVALDHYVWALDLEGWRRHQNDQRVAGGLPMPAHEVPGLWQPESLPGKRGFDVAREALGSAVEPIVADFMTADLDSLGRFDFVLYLGVLYHMENPLAALRRLYEVTGERAVIETEAVHLPAGRDRAICEFFEGSSLAGDPSNWWAPNATALVAMCRSAGFSEVRIVADTLDRGVSEPDGLIRYRLLAHALRT